MISLLFLLWMMFRTKAVEKIKTNIWCSVTFFFLSKNRAVYEKMWKNSAERGRPQMTKRCMRTAYWIPKATNTHSGCVILIAFPLQQWSHELASMLRSTYIACLLLNSVHRLIFDKARRFGSQLCFRLQARKKHLFWWTSQAENYLRGPTDSVFPLPEDGKG